jgi:hypothetical protein
MEDQENSVGMRVARFSVTDIVKLLGVIAFILLAWARVESAIDSITRRLEAIEASQAVYVRADVAQARQETLIAKFDALGLRLAQLESKLDK